eukprot:GHVT01091473.1.p1 GENE.GHVT01091473.1~~GHVT01091473.1.p1  ORF type:complete len:116 (-),score=13.45 GHVT01091473.1:591-938(-)
MMQPKEHLILTIGKEECEVIVNDHFKLMLTISSEMGIMTKTYEEIDNDESTKLKESVRIVNEETTNRVQKSQIVNENTMKHVQKRKIFKKKAATMLESSALKLYMYQKLEQISLE